MMSQTVAWQCIYAQTELAHLTNTIPHPHSYEELKVVILRNLNKSAVFPPDIHDCLRNRGVHLSSPGATFVEYTPSASFPEAQPPVVVFLCDIEGTTTPLPFVREVMMPLAEAHVETYTQAHFPSDPEFQQHVAAAASATSAAALAGLSSAGTVTEPPAPSLSDAFAKCVKAKFADEGANRTVRDLFCRHFREEVKNGSKEAYMKAVEAAIWEEVYSHGQHQTQVFPDVNEFFRFAGDEAMSGSTRIAIYSSGSVAAQQLIMRHTPYGDLNPFITAYFDPTIVGTKLTPKSYMRIRNLLAKQLGLDSQESLQIVFLTDNTSEASAADSSGAIDCPVLCIRPLNEWITIDTMLSVSLPFVTSFTQLMRPKEEVVYKKLVEETLSAVKNEVMEKPTA
jgi:enolase-phosphatase E1